MATVQLLSNDSITIGGTTEVYGTSGAQSVTILDNSNVTFRSGFNSGAQDSITLTGLASDFDVSTFNVSNIVLTSAVDGISITLPTGTNGTLITFDNGDTRLLQYDTGLGAYVLGSQTITSTPEAVTAGPGTYTVLGDPGSISKVVLTPSPYTVRTPRPPRT